MPILNSPILSGDISGTVYATRIEKLKGYPISVTTPIVNQALVFDGSQWAPSTVETGGGGTNVVLMTASANQTVFTFLSSFTYAPGTNNLAVYRNGLRLVGSKDYTETNSTTVTLVQPVAVGSEIVFEAGRIISQGMALSAVTAAFGTFTSYVSAPTVYGKFYGDGSGLTGVASQTIVSTEVQITTAGQTVFTLTTSSYIPNTNNIAVYFNGVRFLSNRDYTETNGTTVTLAQPAAAGNYLLFETGRLVTTTLSSTNPNNLSLTGGTLTGALVGTTAVFNSVSAVALSGVHFGDGSKLTGISSGGTANALPLSGGTLTGALIGTTTIFNSVSAVALSGVHFGDGSKLTGILTSDAAGSKYFTLSGGTINGNSKIAGNLTVYGDLSSTGTQTFANTVFVTTSALSVVNIGTGAALYVGNSGTGDIASFYDIDQNIEVLHIGGDNGTFPNVGVKTSTPNKTFTVNGEISASSDIWTGGKFRGDGSLLTGINLRTYAPLSGATFTGGITASNALFTDSLSLTQLIFSDTWTPTDSSRLWSDIAMSSSGTIQAATVNTGQIYISVNSGNTWIAKDSNRQWTSISMSSSGLIQTATVSPGQIYVSTDSGNTWVAKDSSRNWHSVTMSSDGRIQAATVGSGQIYVSTDYGNNWVAKESSRSWRGIAMSSDGIIQAAVAYNGQIYVSVDSGNTWTAKESTRQWHAIAMSSDGSIQTAVVYNGQIYVSTDLGNTWAAKDSGKFWYGVAMSSDGTRQIAVVTTGQIYVSTDSGNTWIAKDSNRNWYGVAMSSDGSIQTAFVYNGQLYTSAMLNSTSFRASSIDGSFTGNKATFTSSVSAPALSGVHFGDGSRLTGISTYTPPANATFTSSVSAPALSGTHFGDGSKLTGIFIPTISTSIPTGGVEGDIWFQY